MNVATYVWSVQLMGRVYYGTARDVITLLVTALHLYFANAEASLSTVSPKPKTLKPDLFRPV